MRVAIVDMLFTHPPKGGAGVDILETFQRLTGDFDISLFHPTWNSPHSRGAIQGTPPFPISSVAVAPTSRDAVIEPLAAAIRAWKPNVIFVADGWTLKPYLAKTLSGICPTILRLYAYEMLCPRNNERWAWDHRCDNTALMNCQRCLACAGEYRDLIVGKRGTDGNPLTHEMTLADIWDGSYEKTLREALTEAATVVVYNPALAAHLQELTRVQPVVLPGGANLTPSARTHGKGTHDPFTILVPGRMDDPAKGAAIAIQAATRLVDEGIPLRMTVTRRPQLTLPWLNEVGWQDRDSLNRLLTDADVVVMPSVWLEAFGMTWVEALAYGVPVIASQTPGPASYLQHGRNALLYPPDSSEALAGCLQTLISNRPLGRALASAGQKMVKEQLTWDHAAERMKALLHQT
jgi:glycosyltransferase involved in cell wall biosynthesis